METPIRVLLSHFGLSEANLPIDRERLSKALSGCQGMSSDSIKEVIKILSLNPDRETDKKAIMKKTGKESNITSTTNQGLGSVIDNMPYYVDSCAWWIKGWNPDKYIKSLSRDKKKVRRKPVPRIANRK